MRKAAVVVLVAVLAWLAWLVFSADEAGPATTHAGTSTEDAPESVEARADVVRPFVDGGREFRDAPNRVLLEFDLHTFRPQEFRVLAHERVVGFGEDTHQAVAAEAR